MAWKVIKGNTSIQDVPVYDRDGTLVDNLASVTEIRLDIKTSPTASSPTITKTKTGGDIVVDTPSTGYIRITLTPTDTAQTPATYYMALEITWSSTVKYEVRIYIDSKETNEFVIEQDIVNTT